MFNACPDHRRRSAQGGETTIESAVSLVVLIFTAIGIWMLYSDSIIVTTRAMISFFTGDGGASS